MPNSTLTEEHKEVKRLINRWRYRHGILIKAILLSLFGMVLLNVLEIVLKYLFPAFFAHLTRELLTMLMAAIAVWLIFRNRIAFIRRISPAQIELLERTSHIADNKEKKLIMQMLEECERFKLPYNEEQLLRASQPTESGDTLLRAAAYTDNTPQDQLLRPSQTDEK